MNTQIDAAAARLDGVALRTPLLPFRDGAFVKPENLQLTGSFKFRGAYNTLAQLSDEQCARGVVAHSSGNHGQAVAYVSQRLGLRAVIVMPKTAPAVKVEGVKRYGGEIVFTEAVSSARLQKAAEKAAEEGLTMVPPYDDSDIVLGQSTAAYEVLQSHPEITTFLVPIGGGGLLAGTSVTTAHLKPDARVVGVEPDGAPKLSAALAAGHPVALEKCTSLADGLLPLSVGRLTFEYMKSMVHEAVRVTDDEIGAAVKYLWESQGLRVEPSGAVCVAALLTGKLKPTSPTAVMLTGGNVDPALFQRLVA